MSTRRDFLAFTAGAVVARTVLPQAASAEGHRWPDDLFPPGHHPRLDPHPQAAALEAREELDAMAVWDEPTRRMLVWWDTATRHQRFCFVLMLKRVDGGMDMAEAGEMFRLDLANPLRAVRL